MLYEMGSMKNKIQKKIIIPSKPIKQELYSKQQIDDLASLNQLSREKHKNKLIRREIRNEYTTLTNTSQKPNLEALYLFLKRYYKNVDLLKSALEQEKYGHNLWSKLLWNVLCNDDPLSSLEQLFLREEKAVNLEKDAIKKILPNPLIVIVTTTNSGPDYAILTPIFIENIIKKEILKEQETIDLHITINPDNIFNRPGLYQIPIVFLNGDTQSINIEIKLELSQLPTDCEHAFVDTTVLDPPEKNLSLEFFKNYIGGIPEEFNLWQPAATKVLKTAYYFGFWKNPWVNSLLEKWRVVNLQRAMKPIDQYSDLFTNGNRVQNELSEKTTAINEDINKFLILNLPPLIEYDLRNATVDLNVLQHLLKSKPLSHLKSKTLDEFTDEDIRAMSYGITVEISRLKKQGVGTRPLAMIFLSTSKLQFTRLDIGTADSAIRLCLSGYCTRMGEYLIYQQHRIDSARDYYLDALSLNVVSQRQYDFPLIIYFKSFFNHVFGESYDQILLDS